MLSVFSLQDRLPFWTDKSLKFFCKIDSGVSVAVVFLQVKLVQEEFTAMIALEVLSFVILRHLKQELISRQCFLFQFDLFA